MTVPQNAIEVERIEVRQLDIEVGSLGVGEFGVHHGLRDVIDDAAMNALFDQEAKLFPMQFASNTTPERLDLID